MEYLVEFDFESTRYTVWRRDEWGFFVSVAPGEGGQVYLDIDLMVPGTLGTVTPRRVALALDEGVCFRMERSDRSEEEITAWCGALEATGAIIGFELPKGVEMEQFEE